MVPKFNDKCRRKRCTGRRRIKKADGETGPRVKDYLEPPEVGRSKEGLSPKAFGGSTALPTP